MQMGAIVKLAVRGKCFDVGHQTGQMHGFNVVQPEFLEPRGINHGRVGGSVDPIQAGAGSRVFARIQGGGTFVSQYLRAGHQAIDQRAFSCARGSQHQGGFA